MGLGSSKQKEVAAAPTKINRRQSISKLKTGYKLDPHNLSDDYFKSIFNVRQHPLVTKDHLDIFLDCWEKHCANIGAVFYKDPSQDGKQLLFPGGLRELFHEQLENLHSMLAFGTLRLQYKYKRMYSDQQTLELSKSALARAISQVPIIKILDFSEVGLTENTATQFLLCMEDQLEISGCLSEERVLRALREEKSFKRQLSPPQSGKKYIVSPKPEKVVFEAITSALQDSTQIEIEPLYYLERLIYARGSGATKLSRSASMAIFSKSFKHNTEQKTRDSLVEAPKVNNTEKMDRILKHAMQCGEKLYTCNARLDATRTFQKIDEDLSGEIDTAELAKALEDLGMNVTNDLLQDVMIHVDEDRSGKVSEEEFIAAIVKRSRRRKTEETVKRNLVNIMPIKPHVQSYAIHPHSDFMHYWDLVIVVLLIFTATFTIFEICFLGASGELDTMFWVNRTIDIIFTMDLIMHFFIMIPRPNTDAMISDIKIIARQYAQSWLIVDLLSVIPYDAFALGTDQAVHSDNSAKVENLRVLRLLRLLRLLKLARVLRGFRLIRRWEDLYGVTVKYGIQQIIKFMFIMLIICHWIACLWSFVTIFSVDNQSWVIVNDYSDYSIMELYMVCVYWALQTISTIGYGDVANPTTPLERLIAVFAMIVGSIVWAYLMGVIVSNAVSLNKLEQDHHSRMDSLEVFMDEKQLDFELRRRLRFYFRRRRSLDTMENFQDLLRSMSPSLRGDVALSITSKWLPKVPWLRNGEKNFVTSIALNLKPEIYPPMEMVAGDIFHVISRGIAIKDMQVFCGGMVWGLDMILSNQKLRKMKPAIALTFLETSALSRSDFMHVLERFPREKSKVRRSVIWLAFRRKFTSHAQEIEAMTDQLSRVLRRDVLNGIIDVREVFKKCDKNGDGELDFFEFSDGLRALGFSPSQEVLENLMIRFRGHNCNTRISIADFLEFFAVRHRPKRHNLETLPLLQKRKTLLGMTRSLANQGSIIDAETLKRERSLGSPTQVDRMESIGSGSADVETLRRHEHKLEKLGSDLGEMKEMLSTLVQRQ